MVATILTDEFDLEDGFEVVIVPAGSWAMGPEPDLNVHMFLVPIPN